MAEPIETITLPIELTNSNGGRTKHFGKSAAERRKFEMLFRSLGLEREAFEFATRVVVTRILGKRQRLWDYSSGLRGNYKEIEDALVAVGVWHDDGPEWITGIEFRQDVHRRAEGPAVQIEIFGQGDDDNGNQ